MKAKQLLLVLFFFLNSLAIFSQRFSEIEKDVNLDNRNGKFEKSIATIVAFLNKSDVTPYEKYQAYILKSYTHKALFDYDKTFETLDLAQKEGIKSDKKEEVIAIVKAEKAFAYFDIQKYKEAALLMNELKATNYKNLNLGTTSYIVMQDGYLDFLEGNYASAEKKYDEAILYMKKASPSNLPVIFGKKIALYAKTKDKEKAINTFNEGIKIAKNPKNLKYLLYLNECIRTFYEENNEWKLAENTFHRVDSLRTMYNSEESNSKINLLEKDLEIQKKDSEINQVKIFRNSLLVICAILLFGIYLGIKLYKANIEKATLLEQDNLRIREELNLLTNSLDSQGFTKIDLTQYNLTERQLQIINLIREGKSNKEIANTIFVSENTVKYHIKAIYDIMNIGNRSEFFKLISK